MGWEQTIPWLLVVAGWWLVNRQNNIREKRKEIRSFIDKIQTFLDELEVQAIKYHTSGERSDELAFYLKRDLTKKFPNKLMILQLRKLDIKKCNEYLKKFRQAITLDNFDSSAFQTKNISDDLIKRIWLSKELLSQELERIFAKKYP